MQTLKLKYLAVLASKCYNSSQAVSHICTVTYVKTAPSVFSFFQMCKTFSTLETKVESSDSVISGIDIDINSVTNGQPDLEKKLKLILLEMEVFRQEGKRVPSKVSTDEMKELIEMSTVSKRRKHLSFLFDVEMKRANRRHKKEERRLQYEEKTKQNVDVNDDDGHIKYGLGNNTLYFRLRDSTINNFFHNRLMHAMQFGQKIVYDCGYDSHMTRHEAKNCAKQLMLAFSDNRVHQDPFDLYFCNASNDSVTMQALLRYIPTMYSDHFPLTVTEKSYLDLFPRENLVYLTPHCREELTTFDHDAVYIVGAMVDKANQEPLSLAKVKKERLKMAKLPLDKYLAWGSGSGKTLTLNQMILIMLDIRATGNWNQALKHVPRRKLYDSNRETEKRLGRTLSRYNQLRGNTI